MLSTFELLLEIGVGLLTVALGLYLSRRARDNESKSALKVFARMAYVIGGIMIVLASILLIAE